MKIKCGFIAIGAGLLTMFGGLAIKECNEKCGSGLFGFGLAHILLGSLSLLKSEDGLIPRQISVPKTNMQIDLQ